MALKIRLKSALEEAMDFAKEKANQVSTKVRNVVRTPQERQQSRQAFQQNFNKGYQNFVSQQQNNLQEQKRNISDFTNQVINRVRSPETKNKVVNFADDVAEKTIPGYKLTKDVNKAIPGGFKGGVERVKNAVIDDPGQFWIGRGFAEAPENTRELGKALGNEQAGEDLGYAIRGAANLTPFNITNRLGLAGEKTQQIQEENSAQTERQKKAEDIGQALYGTALTAPLGGWKAVLSRGLQGTTLGLAMGTVGTVVGEGRLPTMEELTDAGVNGLENSWQLAFTNAATDKILGKFNWTKGLTDKSIDQTFNLLGNASKMGMSNEIKKQVLGKGLKSLFLRALAEVPAENTLWTLIDQLDGDAKNNFAVEWAQNLPGNILGNVAFAGLQAGTRGTYNFNKESIDNAIQTITKTLSKQDGFIKVGVDQPRTKATSSEVVKTKKLDSGVDSLIQEAKKHKSAEEFINAQPKLYHGTDANFKEFSLKDFGKTDEGFLGKGVYLTGSKTNAKQYGSNLVEASAYLKNPYIYNDSYFFGGFSPSKIKRNIGLPDSASATDIRNALIEKGYDGVIVNELKDSGRIIKNAEVVVFDPKQIKTKSQLTDIYNQATKKATNSEVGKAQGAFNEGNLTKLEELAQKYPEDERITRLYEGLSNDAKLQPETPPVNQDIEEQKVLGQQTKLYHGGTAPSVQDIKTGYGEYGVDRQTEFPIGAYFAEDPKIAETFGDVVSGYLPQGAKTLDISQAKTVQDVWDMLGYKPEFVSPYDSIQPDTDISYFGSQYNLLENLINQNPKIKQNLIDNGYAGIKFLDKTEGKQHPTTVIFNPSQMISEFQSQQLDPTKLIQEDLVKNLEEQKIAEQQPKIDPAEQARLDVETEMGNKVFENEIAQTPKVEGEQKSVLQRLTDDFVKGREQRQKKWDVPTVIGKLKTGWSDKFYYAQKHDPELYLNMRLFAGGGDARTTAVINRNLGGLIKQEADAGRAEDFSNLLALDRLQELTDRGFTRHLNADEIKQGYAELQSKYGPEELNQMQANAQKLRGFLAKLLDTSEQVGLVSKEAADAARQNNELYVTIETLGQMERDFQKQNWLSPQSQRTGKSFNVSKQDILKKIGDSTTGIVDPVESSLQYVVTAINNIERNAILKDFVERRGSTFGEVDAKTGEGAVAIPLRMAENVRERIRINSEIGELKPVQRKIQRLIRTRGKWVNELEKEIKNLNIKGLDLSLKPDETVVNPTRLNRVLEWKLDRLNKLDNELNSLNLEGLGISLQRQPKVAEPTEYFRKTGGKFGSGADQYTKVTIPPRIKSVIEQMVVMPESELKSIQNKIINREGKVSGLVDEILDVKSQLRTQRFIDDLISLPSNEINAIKRKISTREGKLPGLMDEISKLGDDLEGVKDDLIQLRKERGEISDIQNPPEGYGTVNVFRDGIKEEWAVPKELEVAIKNLDARPAGTIVELYNKWINQPFKQAVTSKNLVFALLVNPIKDVQNALFAESTEKGAKEAAGLVTNYVSAMGDAFGLSKQRDNWLLAGGGQSGFIGSEIKVDPTDALNQLRKTGGAENRFTDVIKKPLDLLDYTSRSMEESTRLAKFNKDFKKLSKETQDMVNDPYIPLAQLPQELRQIALDARNITQDFSRMGTAAQQVNKVVPFFNVALQGTLRLGSMAKNNPKRFVTSALVLNAIPALAAVANNMQYEDYSDLRDYERKGNLIWIYKDRTDEERAEKKPLHAFKVPLGQWGAPFYNIAEEIFRFAGQEEPGKISELAQTLLGTSAGALMDMSPVSDASNFIPLPAKIASQLKSNTDFYSGMPIEPDYVDTDNDGIGDTPKDELPASRITGYYTGPTTELLGRLTGPTLGISPAQLDSIINTSTGGAGKTVLNAIDTLMGQAPDINQNVFTKRFLAPRGGQEAADERALQEEELKQIQDETYGKGINFKDLSFASKADASGEMPVDTTEFPTETEDLKTLYDDAQKTVEGYHEKKLKLQYDPSYKSEVKRNKDIKKLDAEYEQAQARVDAIEQQRPEQVFEIEMMLHGEDHPEYIKVEDRGDWAYEQLSSAKDATEFEDLVNKLWENGVLTGRSNGVAAYIKEVYGVDVSKYTGDDAATKKKVGSSSGSSKSIPKLSVKYPTIDTPKIKLGNYEYGTNLGSLLSPIVSSRQSRVKFNVPKVDLVKAPRGVSIKADVGSMPTRIRGLG